MNVTFKSFPTLRTIVEIQHTHNFFSLVKSNTLHEILVFRHMLLGDQRKRGKNQKVEQRLLNLLPSLLDFRALDAG